MPSLRTLLTASALTCFAACAPADEVVDDDQSSAEAAISGGFPVGTQLVTTRDAQQRKAPGAGAALLQTIPDGTTVLSASASPQAGWYGVTWNGKIGWVDGKALARSTAPPSPGSYTRQQVYDLVATRAEQGGRARDLLDPALTTQQLVNAVGWLATHSPPEWGFSTINTGHHYDPAAHSSGFSIDLFAKNAGDDARFMSLVNENPYFVEVGVSGDYVRHRGRITSGGKCSFVENAPTHVHASVRRAFC